MNVLLTAMLRPAALIATKLAQRAKRADDWHAAARNYRRALACDPKNAAKLVQYGNALKECGAFTDAERAYHRSLELDPRNPDAHLQLGHVLKLQARGYDAIAAYRRAIELDPSLYEASLELLRLRCTTHVSRSDLPPYQSVAEPENPLVVFDATDLLDRIQRFGFATGIQRVQICVIASLLHHSDPGIQISIAYFQQQIEDWVVVPGSFFLTLFDLLQSPRGSQASGCRQAMRQLIALSIHGAPLRFRDGAALVNLGSSWTLPNYFLKIRTIKARHRVCYIPFVHDCIPALFPELCETQTVQDYLGWLSGIFPHADQFLVNSSSTARDLTKLATSFGYLVAPRRIALDARFECKGVPAQPDAIITAVRRKRERFVLFVSSFEARKNHRAVFRAWLDLIESRGRRHTPMLICVGGRGWQANSAMEMLRSNSALRTKVKILSGVSDATLEGLYRDCLFTVYPSLYEGWGLPVTESLSHGKVPLVSAVPALQEAGGDLAEYFELARDGDLLSKLLQLIDDPAYLDRREAEIWQRFRGRAWRDVAQEILDTLRPMLAASTAVDESAVSPAQLRRISPIEVGRYYALSKNTGIRLSPELASNEVYRSGQGWWAPEAWGCWMKSGGAELAIPLPADMGVTSLHLDFEGNPNRIAEVAISIDTNLPAVKARLESGQPHRVSLEIASAPAANCRVRIRVDDGAECDLGGITNGLDQRIVSIGLRGFLLARRRQFADAGAAESAQFGYDDLAAPE